MDHKIQQFYLRVGVYPEVKAETPTDICTPTVTAALGTTAQRWKQPKCPRIDGCIHSMWCVQTAEYYSALKKEILGNSLAVQELGLGAFTAEGVGSIPGWGSHKPRGTAGKKKEGNSDTGYNVDDP